MQKWSQVQILIDEGKRLQKLKRKARDNVGIHNKWKIQVTLKMCCIKQEMETGKNYVWGGKKNIETGEKGELQIRNSQKNGKEKVDL